MRFTIFFEKIFSHLANFHTLVGLSVLGTILGTIVTFAIDNLYIIPLFLSYLALVIACFLIRNEQSKFAKKNKELSDIKLKLAEKDEELNNANLELAKKNKELNDANSKFAENDKELGNANSKIVERDEKLNVTNSKLAENDRKLEKALLEIGQLKDAKYTECKFSKRESAISTNCQRKDNEQVIPFGDLKELKQKLVQCLISVKAKLESLEAKEHALIACLDKLENKDRLIYLNYTKDCEVTAEEVKRLLQANLYLTVNDILIGLTDDHYHKKIIQNCRFIIVISNEYNGSVEARLNRYDKDRPDVEAFPFLFLYSQKELRPKKPINIVNSDTLINELEKLIY